MTLHIYCIYLLFFCFFTPPIKEMSLWRQCQSLARGYRRIYNERWVVILLEKTTYKVSTQHLANYIPMIWLHSFLALARPLQVFSWKIFDMKRCPWFLKGPFSVELAWVIKLWRQCCCWISQCFRHFYYRVFVERQRFISSWWARIYPSFSPFITSCHTMQAMALSPAEHI